MNRRTKRLFRFLLLFFLLYAVIGAALYYAQDLFLFHPKPLPPNYAFRFNQSFTELNLTVDNDRNLNLIQFTVPDSLRKGIVLYFHGNRQNAERYAPYVPPFTRNGYAVWMMDYPGFGKSTGKRSEERFYADALRIYKMALQKSSPDRIIIYGKSLGTGIASQLAATQPCRRLVLETPYYSATALARHYFPIYPVAFMMRYELPVHRYLKNVAVPVTVFHGTKDEVIPYRHAEKLKAENKRLELITLPGGKHNNLPTFSLFAQKLDSLLSR